MRKTVVIVLLSLAAPSLSLFSQIPSAPSSRGISTIHIYRNGSRGNTVSILVDGAEVFKLGEHQMITFEIIPGHLEIGASYARQEPTVAIDARPGGEYFFQLLMDVHHGDMFIDPSNAIAVTLTKEDSVLNSGQVHEQPLTEDEKAFIAFRTSQHPDVDTPAGSSASTKPAMIQQSQKPVEVREESLASVSQAYHVKYAGGSLPDGQVGRQLQLRIGSSAIQLGAEVIPSNSVTGITLSQDKHHRIGTGIAISMVTLGAGVPVMFSKSTKDFIEITWNDAGEKGGAAFQADKNEYRGILAALEGVTGKTAMLPTEK